MLVMLCVSGEQVLSLEDEVKNSIPALKKTVESYKEKKMELEREKFKALEQLQVSKRA